MKRRKSVAVELTSLLDVIFIMLFMLMGRGQQAVSDALKETKKMQDDAAAEIQQVKDEYSAKSEELDEREAVIEIEENSIAVLQSRIDGYEKFDEFAEIVTIGLRSVGNMRTITVTNNKSEDPIETFKSDSSVEIENRLSGLFKRKYIDNFEADSSGIVFFVFEYNPETTLVSDRTKIEKVIKEISDSNENFFFTD